MKGGDLIRDRKSHLPLILALFIVLFTIFFTTKTVSGEEIQSVVVIKQNINPLEKYRIHPILDYHEILQELEKAKLIEKEKELAEIKRLQELRAKRLQELRAKQLREQQAKRNTVPSRGGDSYKDNLVEFVSEYTSNDLARLYVNLSVKYGMQYEIDPVWLLAVMKTESTFKNNAVSHAGARGLMQFLPSTARAYGVSTSQLNDPNISIGLAAEYLNDLREQTGSMKMATIAYNQGIGNVKRGTYRTWYYDKVSSNYQELKATLR